MHTKISARATSEINLRNILNKTFLKQINTCRHRVTNTFESHELQAHMTYVDQHNLK